MSVQPGDIELPPPEPPEPTVEGLAAELSALRLRVARLETRVGAATDETLLDLGQQEALAMLGGVSDRYDQLEQAAQQKGRQT